MINISVDQYVVEDPKHNIGINFKVRDSSVRILKADRKDLYKINSKRKDESYQIDN